MEIANLFAFFPFIVISYHLEKHGSANMKAFFSLLVVLALVGGGWYYYNMNQHSSVLSGVIDGANDTMDDLDGSSLDGVDSLLADVSASAEAALNRESCEVITISADTTTTNMASAGGVENGVLMLFSSFVGEGINLVFVQPMNVPEGSLEALSSLFSGGEAVEVFDNVDVFVDGKKLAVRYESKPPDQGGGFSIQEAKQLMKAVAAAKKEARFVIKDKGAEKTVTLTKGERCRVGKIYQSLAGK